MMPDMKTVMLIYAIIAAICAVFMAIMWHFNRKRFAGISFWLIGMILQTVGLILIILRGIVPDFISLIVSNTVIIAGILIIYIGLERFVGKKRLQIHNYILLVIFIAIQVYFTYVQSNLTVRIFNNSAITLILTFQCAWLMLRRVAQDMRRSASIIGIVFSGYVFISLMRIILLAIFPLHSSDFFKSGVPDTFIIIFYTMLAVGLTFSSILMINSRLIGDIRIYAEQRDNTAGKLKERVDEIHNYLNVAGVIILAINTEGKIALINRKGCEILGCGEHEIIGKNWFAEFIPERRREEVKTIFNNLMAGKIKKLEYVEYLVLTRKGEERVIAWHNALIKDNDGRITGTLSSGEDITERKLTEEKLLQVMEGFKRSNTELENYAYVASHDLQEPLRSISSYAHLLEKRYKGKLDADADDFINYIIKGAKRMHQLINDLLAYSRVGISDRTLKSTDCNTALATAIANLVTTISKYRAVITHSNLPIVMADEVRMVQVFQNLLDNAIKYRSKNKLKIHISAEQQGDAWVFSVKDNGLGIDPKHFDRIFVIFQRLHRDEYPGTGIGLAICKKIVEGYGGRFWVESEPGKGSVFYFSIPIRPE